MAIARGWADTGAMKTAFAAMLAVLLLMTGCPKQSPPPATSMLAR
jgi:hypothetical protein